MPWDGRGRVGHYWRQASAGVGVAECAAITAPECTPWLRGTGEKQGACPHPSPPPLTHPPALRPSAPAPAAGQQWKEVRHDKTVTWLAYWRDPVNTKEYK